VELEIWSDIACPWCYIGKRRIEAALSAFPHADELRVRWRSFELDPEAPAEREGELAELLARKYRITPQQARDAQAALTATAAQEGLDFRLGDARSANTFDGHRVLQFAAEHGRQGAMKERLMRAYFAEGRLLSDPATLRELGLAADLPGAELDEVLVGEHFADRVREDERLAAQLGISAVPTFIVDRKVGVTGAQPPELLLEMLRRGWERRGVVPAG
jgi:predicted DsbA family dithiol-disulfide isomerase